MKETLKQFHPLDRQPLGGQKDNVFNGDLIMFNKYDLAAHHAKRKPPEGYRRYSGDIGRMMDLLPELRIPYITTGREKDLEILRTWVKHFEELDVPFVVIRKSKDIVKLYKPRRIWEISRGN